MTDRPRSTEASAPIDDGANRDPARGSEAGDAPDDQVRERQDRPPGRTVQSPSRRLLSRGLLSMLDQEIQKVRAHPDLGPIERARALVLLSREAREVNRTTAPPGR
jgi:hypothetical protein